MQMTVKSRQVSTTTIMGSLGNINQHQDVRVLSVLDTIETLQRLENRLKEVTDKTKRRIKSVESLSLTLALADTTTHQSEEIVQMCQAVARCFPKLKVLEICSEMDAIEDEDPSSRFPIPIQALTALLHPNKGLKKLRELTLDGIRFDADEDRMRILVKAIGRHEALIKCLLFDTSMSTLSSGRSGMEKFVSAVAKRLEKLVLIGCQLAAPEADGLWAGSCLVKICRSTTLQEFKLHNIEELREEHIVMMSQALGSNPSLRKLSILKAQDLTSETAEGKKRKSKKKLKDPALCCPEQETLSSDAGTLALANMLKENTVLEELCLSSFDFNEYSAMFLGNALEKDNTTLLDLWLMVPAHNGGTSSFPVDDPRIDYYLRLNRAGRNRVINLIQQQQQQQQLQPASSSSSFSSKKTITPSPTAALGRCSIDERKAWVNTLVNSKRDIDCSFYLLQNIPSLCDRQQLRAPAPPPTTLLPSPPLTTVTPSA